MISKSIIEAKFRRANLNATYTSLYSQLTDAEKIDFEKQILRLPDEDFVICYSSASSKYFWIISTKRLIISSNGLSTYYSFNMIKQVEMTEILLEENSKFEINFIKILFENGTHEFLKVEKGTWHFVYALLKFLI